MLALDVARIEAGLLLIEVDYISSKKALIPSQKYSPYELGFGKMVHLEKENFIGKAALAAGREAWRGAAVGRTRDRLGRSGRALRKIRTDAGGAEPGFACRTCRLYCGDKQVGKATSTTWSPVLKKMIALASVETAHSQARNQIADGNHH